MNRYKTVLYAVDKGLGGLNILQSIVIDYASYLHFLCIATALGSVVNFSQFMQVCTHPVGSGSGDCQLWQQLCYSQFQNAVLMTMVNSTW